MATTAWTGIYWISSKVLAKIKYSMKKLPKMNDFICILVFNLKFVATFSSLSQNTNEENMLQYSYYLIAVIPHIYIHIVFV